MPSQRLGRILVGHVRGPFGIQGWIDVWPYSADPVGLLTAKTWWSEESGGVALVVEQVRRQGDHLVAAVEQVSSRNQAELLKSRKLWIDASVLPEPQDGEFYWIDLIGCEVVNLTGQSLGWVAEVMDNGAHGVLVVRKPGQQEVLREYLIPFVEVFVKQVDLSGRHIQVDWQEDF